MTDQPDKLDLRSHDIAEDKRQELLRLFPEIRTEGGKIDFDRLKLALGESVDVGKERYGMTWPGKAECFKTIQMPSLGTLRPCLEESVNFDTTENLIIEGDNLEVLKLLQKSYLGKVKMIYIDPPYNTGNDFIYPDNYTESLQTYLEYTGQVDAQGKKFSTNTETDGRFHSKWLNMMYPRLYLARNLLREDGLVFISIDDTEVDNLKKLANEIFGEENFVEQLVWKNKYNSGALTKGFSNVHEYIVCYSKMPVENILAPLSEEAIAEYKGKDVKFPVRGGYVTQPLATGSKDPRPNLRFPITWKGQEIWPDKQWLWSKERVDAALANDEIVVNETDGKLNVRVKQYLRDERGQMRKTKPLSLLIGPYNQEGSKEVDGLLGKDVFDFPKPSALIQFLLSISVNDGSNSEDIILDYMAGSGTTAHAVLDLNKQDGGNRKFILVQLPEPTGRQDYPTIADICKERVRRVIKSLNDEDAGKLDLEGAKPQDRGFKVFKLAESNFTPWEAEAPKDAETLARQLDLHVDHIREGRAELDLLYEILLKSGFPLTTPVQKLTLPLTTALSQEERGKTVYSVAGGALFICLERDLTLDLIRAMADKKPERVVCLDAGFAGNDQLKANAVQIFKTKGVTSFKTV
ncbi:site-specific DNA-methyltransferase [Candidatus Nitrospira inopinata]|uniref:site-specific DNA-methyltransferase (adenine-specific) n=1 Tax=Candidatus Nitrospira inopinata TaxID=1715989 RepID=A0A0S4KM14_9BACT|nr:site-specific DNA-methyltransferase [Candidatus Nitrospira inopinata]CUQ65505.1 Site-specific DNA-methyltransferase (Adenine-specific) [Candidatus Nitrospira inopinata]